MEEDRIIPHHQHHHQNPPIHRPLNNVENVDTAIISGSDVNASHNNDSSSQHSYSSLEDRHHNDDGHTDGKDDRGGGCDMLSNDNESEDEDSSARAQKYNIPLKDVLYNPNLDEEDEAWVYEHRRGGVDTLLEEQLGSMIDRPSGRDTSKDYVASSPAPKDEHNDVKEKSGGDNEDNNIRAIEASQHGQKQSSTSLTRHKLRRSDAVLSCPCCFEIVCMDCQRHERYTNQFRAMFVMNIGVSWDATIYPEHCGGKNTDTDKCDSLDISHIKKAENSTSEQGCAELNTIPVVPDGEATNNWSAKDNGNGDIYYSVHCNKCCTVVAGLNMQDEVYHFFGCLATG